jgi:hypothetical protein
MCLSLMSFTAGNGCGYVLVFLCLWDYVIGSKLHYGVLGC